MMSPMLCVVTDGVVVSWFILKFRFLSLFSVDDIQRIRNMTFHDVLVAVTNAEVSDLQSNVFFWKSGKLRF